MYVIWPTIHTRFTLKFLQTFEKLQKHDAIKHRNTVDFVFLQVRDSLLGFHANLRLILAIGLLCLQLLEAAQSIFADYLSQTTRSSLSPEISQLLVVLSDGRGVFADGTLVRSQTCIESQVLI